MGESGVEFGRKLAYRVGEGEIGVRADRYLAECIQEDAALYDDLAEQNLAITRSQLAKLFEQGAVKVKGKVVSKSYQTRLDDDFELILPPIRPLELEAENIPLEIFYEDESLLVVNKPKGMVVHPAPGHWEHTLVNALLYHCKDSLSGINGVSRPGILHRIDKDTSGLLMVAKNDNAHVKLAAQIQDHSFTRIYRAVVVGRFKTDTGTVREPIGRHPVDRKRMCVTPKGREAATHYRIVAQGAAHTHLELQLETGRTHQIRVHMAYLGHPVLGDPLYGSISKGIEGQCLHAKTLGFIHPVSGKYMEFTSELPEDFQRMLRKYVNV